MTTQPFLYWPKVQNPNFDFPQMKPDTLQPRFFFGGSQVPISLEGHIGGEGIRKHKFSEDYESSTQQAKKNKEVSGQGRTQYTSIEKNNKILLPKNYKR